MTKILLTEDDPDLRFILHQILDSAGYNVVSLNEGSPIVNGKVEWPDVFILDLQIPTIDGLALSKYLKINNETKNIPIIMISAYPEAKKKARQIGVSDFLQKPFDAKTLIEMIEQHIHRAE